jgi:hypothetical protein
MATCHVPVEVLGLQIKREDVGQELAKVGRNRRVLASKLLKLPQVPTVSLAHLTDAQVKALTIADNRLSLRR